MKTLPYTFRNVHGVLTTLQLPRNKVFVSTNIYVRLSYESNEIVPKLKTKYGGSWNSLMFSRALQNGLRDLAELEVKNLTTRCERFPVRLYKPFLSTKHPTTLSRRIKNQRRPRIDTLQAVRDFRAIYEGPIHDTSVALNAFSPTLHDMQSHLHSTLSNAIRNENHGLNLQRQQLLDKHWRGITPGRFRMSVTPPLDEATAAEILKDVQSMCVNNQAGLIWAEGLYIYDKFSPEILYPDQDLPPGRKVNGVYYPFSGKASQENPPTSASS